MRGGSPMNFALALSVWLFRILRNRQYQLPGRNHFALMTAFCHFGHGSFRFDQPQVQAVL
jgi:hypothetical protein